MRTFGLNELVLVGDRGMIAQRQIGDLKEHEGLSWVTALKSGAIAKLISSESLQLGLFDERNLFEFSSPDYPAVRLIACRNADLARLRAYKREALLAATEPTNRPAICAMAAGWRAMSWPIPATQKQKTKQGPS